MREQRVAVMMVVALCMSFALAIELNVDSPKWRPLGLCANSKEALFCRCCSSASSYRQHFSRLRVSFKSAPARRHLRAHSFEFGARGRAQRKLVSHVNFIALAAPARLRRSSLAAAPAKAESELA